jgi:hypothetical protein
VYAVTAFIENKSVVELQRRFGREFGVGVGRLEKCHLVTLFCTGNSNSRTFGVFAVNLLARHDQAAQQRLLIKLGKP